MRKIMMKPSVLMFLGVALLAYSGCGGGSVSSPPSQNPPTSTPTLKSITVTPANSAIVVPATTQFTATGRFSDGSTQNLTSSVTWNSSATNIATVSNAGLATGAGAGSTTVTATSGAVSGSTALTVAAPPPPAIHNEWTWVGGSQVINQTGTYGTQGTPDATNTPGARSAVISWTDTAGNFWLFGGTSSQSGPYFNDLWKYSDGQWTWMSGSSSVNQPANYGVQGVAASGNTPGARVGGNGWTDAGGDLWLFGGYFHDPVTGSNDLYNDVWKYSGREWTWMGGSNEANKPGVYGTQGVPSSQLTYRVHAMQRLRGRISPEISGFSAVLGSIRREVLAILTICGSTAMGNGRG